MRPMPDDFWPGTYLAVVAKHGDIELAFAILPDALTNATIENVRAWITNLREEIWRVSEQARIAEVTKQCSTF